MITSTIIWIPKLRVNPKMNPKVDPKTMKGYAKLWRWWTLYRKCRQKRWTENSEWHSRAKDDTKNGSLTDDLQEVNNDAIITCDTKNDTNNWWMKLYILEANFWNDSMVFNKRLLWKRKIWWYTTPMKVLLLSSFEKQKEYVLTLLRNSY